MVFNNEQGFLMMESKSSRFPPSKHGRGGFGGLPSPPPGLPSPLHLESKLELSQIHPPVQSPALSPGWPPHLATDAVVDR
jgi:hypothetical protein